MNNLQRWVHLWKELFKTLTCVIAFPFVCLWKSIPYHPHAAVAGVAALAMALSVSQCVRHAVAREQMSYCIDSLSSVIDTLKAGDRYEEGYADGMAAQERASHPHSDI